MNLIKHIRYVLLPFILLFGNNLMSKNHPDTLNVGFYITSIRNIDFANSAFNADIWVWLHYKNHKFSSNSNKDIYRFPGCLEWVNDITEQTNEKDSPDIDDINAPIIWCTYKVNRKFRKKWNLSSYPFDKQSFEIKLESDFYDIEDLILTADKAQIDSSFISGEKDWTPLKKTEKFVNYVANYNTSFGDPINKNGQSKYSGVTYSFDSIRLNRWTTFFKLFTGILISYFIALSVFLIKPTNLDARFGLVVGALFSSIGSKYIVDSMIPIYYENTLFDNIHNVTFIYIFIITVISIFSLKLLESNEIKYNTLSKRLDKFGLIACFSSYFVIIVFLINHYINN